MRCYSEPVGHKPDSNKPDSNDTDYANGWATFGGGHDDMLALTDTLQETGQPWVIYCDGSAMPNPGRIGIGAVITEPDGTRHEISQALHVSGCNNEAELMALIAALRASRSGGASRLEVFSDNSIIVEQLGSPGIKPLARLAAMFDEARVLLKSFEHVSLKWIPRHRNGEADALARAALGMPPKPPPKTSRKRK